MRPAGPREPGAKVPGCMSCGQTSGAVFLLACAEAALKVLPDLRSAASAPAIPTVTKCFQSMYEVRQPFVWTAIAVA